MFSPSWVWWLRTSSPWSPRREPFRRKTEVVWSIMGCRNVVGEPFMLTTRRRNTLIPRREEKHPTQCALSPIQENLKTAECPQPSLPGDYNLGDIFPGPQCKDHVTITASWLGRLKGCASLLQSARKWIGIRRTQVSPSSEDGFCGEVGWNEVVLPDTRSSVTWTSDSLLLRATSSPRLSWGIGLKAPRCLEILASKG